jgi:hypothetical protein
MHVVIFTDVQISIQSLIDGNTIQINKKQNRSSCNPLGGGGGESGTGFSESTRGLPGHCKEVPIHKYDVN